MLIKYLLAMPFSSDDTAKLVLLHILTDFDKSIISNFRIVDKLIPIVVTINLDFIYKFC